MGKSIPRPPNSFMLWSASNRKNVQREHPDSTNADISRVLGKKWNKMTNEATTMENSCRRRKTNSF